MSETLFASVLHLSRADCHALRISDPYSLHRVVYSLFPDIRTEEQKQSSESSGIQFADMGGDVQGRKVLLLSTRPPAERIDGEFGEVQSKPLPPKFLDHRTYRFCVAVNPTRRDNASKKLLPVRSREAVASWFAERAEASWGFQVDHQRLQVHDMRVLRFKDKAMRDVTLAQAHLEGVLRVIDAERFRASVTHGIGRGRAFGCGLLQIVPVND